MFVNLSPESRKQLLSLVQTMHLSDLAFSLLCEVRQAVGDAGNAAHG